LLKSTGLFRKTVYHLIPLKKQRLRKTEPGIARPAGMTETVFLGKIQELPPSSMAASETARDEQAAAVFENQ
jgi:hypothetical protein